MISSSASMHCDLVTLNLSHKTWWLDSTALETECNVQNIFIPAWIMRLLELNVRLYKDISIRIFKTLSSLWKIKHSATFLQLSKQLYEMVQHLFRSTQPKTIVKALRWNLKNLSCGLNPPKSAKTRFKFSAGLNLETFDTILSGTNHI